MVKGTKKIDFAQESASWKNFIDWLREQKDEETVKEYIFFEIKNQNRPHFIDRARTRYNKIRSIRELKELEELSGQTINVSYQ